MRFSVNVPNFGDFADAADAGATWWDERQPITSDSVHQLTPVLRRLEPGPPTL